VLLALALLGLTSTIANFIIEFERCLFGLINLMNSKCSPAPPMQTFPDMELRIFGA
jgi:hypothetical protein